MNYLYAILALLAIALGCEQWGEHRVQVKWDQDKAVRQARLDDEIARGEKIIADMRDKFKKEKAYAESEASKRAVDRFLRDHGLLPSGLPVRPVANGQAQVPQGADGTTCESGFAERIKDFAARSLRDARKVAMCTEWAVREGLEIE
ncbi:MAG: hypothetical protein WC859_10125 [Elusimicrobiota bacterium]|jgi:hypothetical protein